MKLRPTPQIIACAAYVILHCASHLTAAIFEGSSGLSIWYPPNGLALSLLILLGPRYSPVVFLTNVALAYLTATHASWWGALLYPTLITVNTTLTASIARYFTGSVLLPRTLPQALVFSLVIILSPLTLSLAGTGLHILWEPLGNEQFLSSAYQWWVGDVSGLLTVLPVVMVFAPVALFGAKPIPRRKGGDVLLTAIQAIVLLACLACVFAFEPIRQHNAFYLCFIPLTWVALTHGLPGATLATLATTMAGLIGMHFMGSADEQIVNFLLFEIAASAVGLGLGAAASLRMETEAALAESKARFERVISGAQLGLWDWDVVKHHISYNQRWAEMIGSKLEQIEPHYDAWENLIHPADRERVSKTLAAHLFGRSPLYEIEYRVRCAGETWRWLLTRGSVVERDKLGHPLLVSGTHLDITDRKHVEVEMRRLLQINEATTDFILTTDVSGGIVYANAALLRLQKSAGADAPLNRALFDLMPVWAAEKLRNQAMTEALASGAWTGELALSGSAGAEIPVSVVTLAHRDQENDSVSFSLIMRDISQQKKAEDERIERERGFLQMQKLESLGVLAGGIAHDFNNLLTVMLGNASLARFDLPSHSPLQAPLGQIESAAINAAELCQQMLAYAGRSPLAFQSVDLGKLIEDSMPLLMVSISKFHTLEIQLPGSLPLIHADPTQIRQVVMNLTINASEAIGDHEGNITLRVSSRSYAEPELRTLLREHRLVAGRYLVLEVQDTGPGMAPEVINHVFEPFYSTKPVGHGLGLAAVLGIMKSHGGGIHVTAALGTGSCFQLLFPALDSTVQTSKVSSHPENEWKGAGLILVADDENLVRNNAARSLESLGFTPLLARDGVEALELYQRHLAEIRLVLLDLTMPRMNGEEIFHRMQDLDRSKPIVLMSSFAEKWLLDRFVASKPAAFIAKPFDRRALQTCLQQLLAG